MPKILSKSGDSLADVYDIEGSIAGIDELQSKDVNLVHEMGGVLFSERMVTRIIALSSGDIAQNTDSDVDFSFAQHTRLLGVSMVADTVARTTRAVITIGTPPAGSNTEIPIWMWGVGDVERSVKLVINGTTAVVTVMGSIIQVLTPSLLGSQDDPASGFTVAMHARSSAFGAGTVEITTLIHVAFPQLGGVSSRGLPLPSW